MGGHSFPQNIKDRIDIIKEQIKQTDDMKQCERLQERISRLQNGVIIITVGGNTEIEMIEKKHRIEDALEASRASLEQGIVPGGGSVLVKISKIILEKAIKEYSKDSIISFDFLCGLKIIKEVCLSPFKTIINNTNGNPDVVMNELLDLSDDFCYNALTRRIC